jgi:histone-lysine N-methyltransferase SETD2
VRRDIVKKLAVKWAGEKKGWGVFAAEDIYKGEFIVAYAGEVLDREEMERRERERSGKGVVDTYLMQVTKERSIDGTSVGNVSRLV